VQVSNLRAEADPRGGRVELSWVTPRAVDFPDFRGVKVLRRAGSYPDAQQLAADPGVFDDDETGAGLPAAFTDTGLKAETVYYYAVAAYDGAHPPNHFVSYVSALATAAYGTGERMYEELPGQYQRFDTVLPPDAPLLDPLDSQKGQLRRFVEMFGLQFDLMRSYASVMRSFSDVERVDGALLPLLAQWLGWQTDYSLPLSKQRNEVRYAPHFYRTTGIAANLKATLNRLTTWDAQLKEFAHNVMRANDPERLTINEMTRRQGTWGAARETTADWSFEGRPSVVSEGEGQQWLFYHARHKARAAGSGGGETTRDSSHVWFKLCNFGEWLPAQQLTDGASLNRAPCAVRREADGSFLVFYHAPVADGLGGRATRLRLSALAAGRPYQPARLKGTEPAPFALAEGEALNLSVDSGAGAVPKKIIFFREDFADITKATAAEVAALLEREAAGVRAEAAEDGTILLTSLAASGQVTLAAAGQAAAKLGLPASGGSVEAAAAEMLGSLTGPFALEDRDTLVVKVDGGLPRAVTFSARQFNDIKQATAAEVAAVLKTYLPRSAFASGGRLRLVSTTTGSTSSVVVDVSASTAAPKLGLGVPPPPLQPALSDAEPAAFEDVDGGVWLFWSRRVGNTESLHYNRFDGKEWGEARALTPGQTADREPFVLYDAEGGRLWVFWSGRRKGGRWNVFYATTTNLDFETQQETDWQRGELAFDPQEAHDNREPAARLRDGGNAELYFTSNRSDGQNVWTAHVTPGAAGAETQVTRGQFTARAPAVLGFDGHVVRLWFRTNASRVFSSALYPAARTTDARNSGSTTVDTRNPAKFGIRGSLADVMHYTYDMGRGNENWYSRDTVGIYLTPDTTDEALVIRKRNQIESLLRKFLPIQVRGVVIIQQVFPEQVYTYDFPGASPQVRIRETMIDSVLGEVNKWPQSDAHKDAVDFHWFRLSGKADTGDHMPDAAELQIDLSARTYMKNVGQIKKEEGDK
jgi:phage tail-like protein